MAELTAAQRKKLKKGTFAVPSREAFPIPDAAHARAALSMSHGGRSGKAASQDDHAAVHALVKKKFPEMWQEHMENAHGKESQAQDSEGMHMMPGSRMPMKDSEMKPMMKKPTGHQMVERGLAEYRKRAGAKK